MTIRGGGGFGLGPFYPILNVTNNYKFLYLVSGQTCSLLGPRWVRFRSAASYIIMTREPRLQVLTRLTQPIGHTEIFIFIFWSSNPYRGCYFVAPCGRGHFPKVSKFGKLRQYFQLFGGPSGGWLVNGKKCIII